MTDCDRPILLKNSMSEHRSSEVEKIDLSDRPRISDLILGKGSSTFKTMVECHLEEFFNRIGQIPSFMNGGSRKQPAKGTLRSIHLLEARSRNWIGQVVSLFERQ